jgi:hypothetical protein
MDAVMIRAYQLPSDAATPRVTSTADIATRQGPGVYNTVRSAVAAPVLFVSGISDPVLGLLSIVNCQR